MSRLPRVGFVLVSLLLLVTPVASRADDVLTVSDVIQRRAELNGKVVTVRGMFALEGAEDILVPDHETELIDDRSHIIDLQTDGYPLYRLYGRLELSRVIVKGRIRYIRECDYRLPPENPEIISVCHIISEIQLHSISSLKIIDTYTMNDPRLLAQAMKDPRVTPEDLAPANLETLPPSDPEYTRVAALARNWRQAILDRDFRALAKLSLEKRASSGREVRQRMGELSDRKDRFYNVVFRGRDRLQAQLRRNRSKDTFIGFIRKPGDNAPEWDVLPYEGLHVCYCLREVCTERNMDTLKYFSYGSNLKDPFWCFKPALDEKHGWNMNVYNYYTPD